MSDTPKLPTNKTSGLARFNAGESATCTIGDVATGLTDFRRLHPEISRLEIFGSVARGEATASSDVDLVATFVPSLKNEIRGLAFFGYLDDLEIELSVVLDRPVHVTDHAGVESNLRIGNTSLARAIARDGRLIYEADHQTARCAGPHDR